MVIRSPAEPVLSHQSYGCVDPQDLIHDGSADCPPVAQCRRGGCSGGMTMFRGGTAPPHPLKFFFFNCDRGEKENSKGGIIGD